MKNFHTTWISCVSWNSISVLMLSRIQSSGLLRDKHNWSYEWNSNQTKLLKEWPILQNHLQHLLSKRHHHLKLKHQQHQLSKLSKDRRIIKLRPRIWIGWSKWLKLKKVKLPKFLHNLIFSKTKHSNLILQTKQKSNKINKR